MSNTFYVVHKEDDLQHHGVLGMKWGVRKQVPTSGTRKVGSSSSIAKGGTGYSSQAKKKGTASSIVKKGNTKSTQPNKKGSSESLGLNAAGGAALAGGATVEELRAASEAMIKLFNNWEEGNDTQIDDVCIILEKMGKTQALKWLDDLQRDLRRIDSTTRRYGGQSRYGDSDKAITYFRNYVNGTRHKGDNSYQTSSSWRR